MPGSGWGPPTYPGRDDLPSNDPRRPLLFNQWLLGKQIADQRNHIAAGTRGEDPDSPDEILRWAEAELAKVERQLAELDERLGPP